MLIPTFQRRAHLRRSLEALERQTLPASAFEVIVSVDGSSDGTTEMLRGMATTYQLTVLDGPNRGRASALNRALAAASGDVVILLDDDMEPEPGFVEAHLARHDGSDGGDGGDGRDAALGVIGAVPVRVDPQAPPATRFVGERFNGHLANLARPGYRPLLTDFYSGNFSVRRATLASIGGFDEGFTRYGNEDLELSVRLRRAGVTLVYCPEALAYQTNDKGFAELARDRREEGQTAVLFAAMHPEVFGELKLAAYGDGPALGRSLRAALLGAARWWPSLPQAIIRVERMLGRLDPPGLAHGYPQALGYFYWLGVREALAERRGALDSCPPLRELARALHA